MLRRTSTSVPFSSNAECNVMIFDDATAQQMTAAFEAELQHSVEIRHEPAPGTLSCIGLAMRRRAI